MDTRVRAMYLMATTAAHSAWAIGISEAQRQAIYADPHWNGGDIRPGHPPRAGLSAARQMAMLTYRSAPAFERRFGRNLQGSSTDWFQVQSYLNYQGHKLVDRMDARTYVRLTQAMDSHDVSRGRGSLEQVLGSVSIPALVLGIRSDLLYPASEQQQLASGLG